MLPAEEDRLQAAVVDELVDGAHRDGQVDAVDPADAGISEQVGRVHVHEHRRRGAAQGRCARVMDGLGEDAAEDVGSFLAAGAVIHRGAGDQFTGFEALLLVGGGECGAERAERKVSKEKVDFASRTSSLAAAPSGFSTACQRMPIVRISSGR
jgi:hypothetical protein